MFVSFYVRNVHRENVSNLHKYLLARQEFKGEQSFQPRESFELVQKQVASQDMKGLGAVAIWALRAMFVCAYVCVHELAVWLFGQPTSIQVGYGWPVLPLSLFMTWTEFIFKLTIEGCC